MKELTIEQYSNNLTQRDDKITARNFLNGSKHREIIQASQKRGFFPLVSAYPQIKEKLIDQHLRIRYFKRAIAKSIVRIETLFNPMATQDTPSVFFCVYACAHLSNRIHSMVALVGHPKGWLDSIGTSSLNPVNVTAQEIETSNGDYHNQPMETVIMVQNPITLKLFTFFNYSTSKKVQIIAITEEYARSLYLNQCLYFMSRKPLFNKAEVFNV